MMVVSHYDYKNVDLLERGKPSAKVYPGLLVAGCFVLDARRYASSQSVLARPFPYHTVA